MSDKSEYGSKYVWHKNAYSFKAEPLPYRNYSLLQGPLSPHHYHYKGSLQQLSLPQLEKQEELLKEQQRQLKEQQELLQKQQQRLKSALEKKHEQDKMLEKVLGTVSFPQFGVLPPKSLAKKGKVEENLIRNFNGPKKTSSKTSTGNSNSNGNSSSSNRQPKRLATTRRYSLDADARGIKSHFLPASASMQVLVDLGIKPSTTTKASKAAAAEETGAQNETRDKNNNQYYSTVYQTDFAPGTKN